MMAIHDVPQGVTAPPQRSPDVSEEEAHRAPGTLVLVFVFLAAFVLYYFANWKLLSQLWRIG